MDPTENLKQQRVLSARIAGAASANDVDVEDCFRLAELVQALDGWLASGGFLPKQWENKAGAHEPCDECKGTRWPTADHEDHCSLNPNNSVKV